MKKQFFSTMKIMSAALLAAAALMTSCEQGPEEDLGNTIKIKATIENFEATGGVADGSFEEGDAIGLHIITPSKLHLNNSKFTYSDGKFGSSQPRYWHGEAEVEAELIAYSPYWSKGAYSADNGYSMSLNTDQSTKQAYKASDLMFAYATSKPTNKEVELPFKHILSKMEMVIENPKNETIESITVSNLSNVVTYKYATKSVVPSNTKSDFIPAAVTMGDKSAYVLIVAPQTVSGSVISINTTSGKLFRYEIAETTFESGKAYGSTLSLANESLKGTFTPSVTDWVTENDGAMEFERIENDIIIQDNPSIDDVDPTLAWPLISTLPSLVAPDTTSDVVVVLNTEGTDVTSKDVLYAHTGVITSNSTSGDDWKYVKHAWDEDAADCRLTHIGGSIFALLIPGGPREFYGVPEGEELKQLAFVFRTSGGTKEVKNNGQDIYVDLVDASEFVVKFVSPSHGEIVAMGDVVSVRAAAQNAKSISLMLNGSEVATSNYSQISYDHTVSEVGDLVFEAVATDANGATASASVTVAALGATENMARPAGVKEGVTINGSEATVVLYAPGKNQVILLGDFNGFAPSNEYMMKRDGDYFWTTVSNLKPNTEYAYQFLVDGTIRVGEQYSEKVLDPWNDSWINYYYDDATQSKLPKPVPVYPDLKEYPANTTDIVSVFETNEVEYSWNITNFDRPTQNSLVIYELLVRDFTEEGTIAAVIDRLDYLDALGVNAIELLPIQEFDGNDSWGYNPCFYFAPDKAYGTKEDYKRFVDECHKRGIAVILDVVFNHTTGQFPWAKMWWDQSKNKTASNNPFFNVDAPHNWSVYHDLNHTYHKTRSYIKDVLRFWLKEYNIDGYRFDLTKGIVQNPGNYDASGYSQQRIDWLKEYADAIREAEGGSDAYIIFEHFCDKSEEDVLAAHRGIMLWRNANNASCQSGMGYGSDSDFSSISAYGRVGFAESHDEERVAYKIKAYGASNLKDNFPSANVTTQLTGLYAVEFLSPYPKMLWQFGELAYDYSIDMNDKGQLGNGDQYRTHRKPIPWKLGYDKDVNRTALYENLCKIISFRTENPQIFSSDSGDNHRKTWNVGGGSMGGKTLVLSNSYGGVIAIANLSANSATTTVSVPQSGEWTNILTGKKENLGSSYTVTLGAHQCVVLGRVN